MKVHVFTLFPELFTGMLNTSILGKAQEKGLLCTNIINFRHFSTSKHGVVDDVPYGGGGGMVLKPEPIFAAVEHVLAEERFSHHGAKRPKVIMMCPQGKRFTHRKAQELAQEEQLLFICGHYEGIDERIRQSLITDEISIGDYVLTGGELPAMVVIDSVARLLPGVLGNDRSAQEDSFCTGLLEYPQYTRPAQFRDMSVPDVLLSGHHAKIEVWRRKQALRRTVERRPDLLEHVELTSEEQQWLKEFSNKK